MEVNGKEKGVTPEEEIRAVAIKAAASLCAPVAPMSGQTIPNLEDVLFVADVFYGYVQGGWEEALRIHATTGAQKEQPHVQNVELREPAVEQQQVQAPAEPVVAEEPAPAAQSAPEAPREEPAAPARPAANVIPLEARGRVTKEQSHARRALDRIRGERAENLLNLALTAKTEEHKGKLMDMVEEAGLKDYTMEINGAEQELGAFVASLLSS